MGRLLIFLAVIVVTVILLGLWGLFLDRQKQRAKLGLENTKKKIEELQTRDARQIAALTEIRNLADTEVTLADESGTNIHMWLVVQGLTTEILEEEGDKR